jgi:hypothetical protein
MGKEIYMLHDNGRKLFTSPSDCTPMQRFVYVMAKNHHEEQERSDPSGINKADKFSNNVRGGM